MVLAEFLRNFCAALRHMLAAWNGVPLVTEVAGSTIRGGLLPKIPASVRCTRAAWYGVLWWLRVGVQVIFADCSLRFLRL